jgi:hypothetical protein
MATSKVTLETPSPNSFHSGSTISNLEELVEHAFLKVNPPISIAQLRILLRVEQAL